MLVKREYLLEKSKWWLDYEGRMMCKNQLGSRLGGFGNEEKKWPSKAEKKVIKRP